MDHRVRKSEREALAQADPETLVAHARDHLRTGNPGAALALVAGRDEPALVHAREEFLASSGFTAPELAHAWGFPELGLDELAWIAAQARETPPPGLATLAHHPDPLARGLVARLAPVAADDPDPYVRARARPAVVDDAAESVGTRLFGAHGPMYESGIFVGFLAGYDARLSYFSHAFLERVSRLFACGPGKVAFARTYGLAWPADDVDLDALVAAVDRTLAAQVLPFELELTNFALYDHLTGLAPSDLLSGNDERLARRFSRDLNGHEARLRPMGTQLLHHRLLREFPPNVAPSGEALAPLLDEARARYGPVGFRSVEIFVERALAARKSGLLGGEAGPSGFLLRPRPEDDPR
ncbi:MAG: hypothetical protein R3F62_06495 [Planctomycetota bacterium]